MKRLGMNDSDILEVMGWRDVTMLRWYIAAVVVQGAIPPAFYLAPDAPISHGARAQKPLSGNE